MTLSDLIARVEAATGPDRETDGMIWCAANDYQFLEWDGDGCRYRAVSDGWFDSHHIPSYTASLDAAIGLVERVLPGWVWNVSSTGTAWLMDPNNNEEFYDASGCETLPIRPKKPLTPPIALLLALLRSLQHQGEQT